VSLQDISEPVDPVVRVGDDVSEDGLSLLLVLVAPVPPRLLHADVHVGVSEALGPDHVENVANCVGELGVGHLEAGAKPFITGAVHGSVRPVIIEAVFGLSRRNVVLAGQVVLTAARICGGMSPQLVILLGSPAFSTPVCAWHSHGCD